MALVSGAGAVEAGADHSYAGDLLTRSTLTGDWGGARDDLAAKGITFDANVTQIVQGVVDGGVDASWVYSGRADLTGHLDTQKLGLWPGGFLTVELEGNWEDSVNSKTGALMPADTNGLFPLPSGDKLALPDLSFAQFVSRYAGAIVGKIQTMTAGDLNEFAHGKGDTQFFNLAFNINPTALIVPYSTLGVGLIVLPTADPDQAMLNFNLLSATGNPTTAGFDDINGAIFAVSGRVRTRFFGLTGHQLLGGLYSNKRYTSIDQRLGDVIQNRRLATRSGTWAMYYNFDQYFYETKPGSEKGAGVFGRFGASEGNPNPVQHFYSLGIGAKGIIAGRDHDQFGLGFYYSSIENPTFQTPLATRSFLRDEWGFEAYYNVALTPWLLVTPDIQVIRPARRGVDDATVLGFRGQVVF